ncbi:MAG TPA: EAL domain-containing protein [Candidatus Omnitrophota bacterium]|nr:EAL domain-containing protein [Candidatus Omnitrophota bacterium]
MINKINLKKHILLVDDDASVSQMLSMLLESRGYEVDVVGSGKEALQKIASHIDLVLLDIVLPDQDGFDVCRKLKENEDSRHIPIIIQSAKMLPENIVEGLYLGADDYLVKPFEFEELVARMEAVLRRSAPFRDGKLVSQGEEAIIRELRTIIDDGLIIPFFQPIVQLQPFRLIGFEAFCRPKTQSMLANPELLFKAALQFGLYQEMEMASWKKAIEYASRILTNEKLFLNCNPYFVEGPRFLTIKSLFEQSKIKIENVILEITERSAVTDFKIFFDHLKRFREYGFKFAVDDVGGGYASLESIVQTRPEIVKIDRHIVNNLHADSFKKSIVKFITSFCKENNILCIAEGIETKQDLLTLIDLGVDAGQGYYLSQPAPYIKLDEVEEIQHLVCSH